MATSLSRFLRINACRSSAFSHQDHGSDAGIGSPLQNIGSIRVENRIA
jgi:hypothetical protein